MTQKPLMVIRREFIDQLQSLISTSPLPFCIIEPILTSTLQVIAQEMARQEREEMLSYRKQMEGLNNEEIPDNK